MSIQKVIALLTFTMLLTTSCINDLKDKLNPKPDASSGVNQIAVICDDEIWEGAIGDSMRYYYEAPYPILNQPEPQFDLRHFTPQDLIDKRIFRELRAYIVLGNTSDEKSPTTQMIKRDIGTDRISEQLDKKSYGALTAKDKWANGQQLSYLFAADHDELLEAALKSYPALSTRVRDHNREVLDAQVFFEGLDTEIMAKIRQKVGIDVKIPMNFEIADEDGSFLWLLYDRNKSVSNLIFYSTTYSSPSQVSKAGIKALRDSVTTKYIHSTLDSTYMIINDVDLPMFYYTRDINGQYAAEARGIWEMENDFMGGPFNSFILVDDKAGKLIFIDGFVLAPGEKKRDLMQKLTHIIEQAKLASPQSVLQNQDVFTPISVVSEHH